MLKLRRAGNESALSSESPKLFLNKMSWNASLGSRCWPGSCLSPWAWRTCPESHTSRRRPSVWSVLGFHALYWECSNLWLFLHEGRAFLSQAEPQHWDLALVELGNYSLTPFLWLGYQATELLLAASGVGVGKEEKANMG